IVTVDCPVKERSIRMNPFMQGWRPKLMALPRSIQTMIRTCEKYNLRPEGIAFSRDILRSMPMWFHREIDALKARKLARASKVVTCLREKHSLKTVGDFENFVTNFHAPGHLERASCKCGGCMWMKQSIGCAHPDACAKRARALLDLLPPKWDPRGRHPADYEEENHSALDEVRTDLGDDLVLFDRRVTVKGNIADAYRIFTDGEVCNDLPDVQIESSGNEVVTVATDGSCLKNGQTDAQAGAGVFFGVDHTRNRSIRLPPNLAQSNQTGEAAATLLAT
ncbi:hypothetical protein L226DRAFT_446382, partial [Lentinus tigrinus ALCF2SS1-7]